MYSKMKHIPALIAILSFSYMMNAQQISLAEKLGYKVDAKLLIIHADDAGVSHSTNQAVIDAFEKGKINSTSIIVPAPWFPEMASFAIKHPDYDYGLHLAFTSEWYTCKWGGIACSDEIKSLLDTNGYFYATTSEAVSNADPMEAELEMRAQIDKALSMGLKPSHFDTHMNTFFGTPELFSIYLKLGDKYRIPVLIHKNELELNENIHIPELQNHLVIDNQIEAETDVLPTHWASYYSNILRNLKPGINQLIVHLAYDDEETRALTSGHEYWDAAWRQRDRDYIMSDEFKRILDENDILLITWKEIQKVLYP
jgi:chitin disaccharide deacetylase